MPSPRLALVGCGAIAERFHAPALRRDPSLLRDLLLVDPDARRTDAVRAALGGGTAVRDYREALGRVDGAIVTTPHHLHFAIIRDFLEAGIPVLSEKPLAGSHAEAAQLVDLATARGVPLAVNNTRRLYPSHRRIAELLRQGDLGALRRIRFADGDRFDWPLASPSLFGTAAGGHGILLDIGAHVVDLVLWWLGADATIAAYSDDAMGGTEATAALTLRRGAATAEIRLSWLAKLPNQIEIDAERGSIRTGIYDWGRITVTRDGRTKAETLPEAPRDHGEFALQLHDNFLQVLAGKAPPIVSGADVLPSLAIIEQAYAQRSRRPMPWFDAWTKAVAV